MFISLQQYILPPRQIRVIYLDDRVPNGRVGCDHVTLCGQHHIV